MSDEVFEDAVEFSQIAAQVRESGIVESAGDSAHNMPIGSSVKEVEPMTQQQNESEKEEIEDKTITQCAPETTELEQEVDTKVDKPVSEKQGINAEETKTASETSVEPAEEIRIEAIKSQSDLLVQSTRDSSDIGDETSYQRPDNKRNQSVVQKQNIKAEESRPHTETALESKQDSADIQDEVFHLKSDEISKNSKEEERTPLNQAGDEFLDSLLKEADNRVHDENESDANTVSGSSEDDSDDESSSSSEEEGEEDHTEEEDDDDDVVGIVEVEEEDESSNQPIVSKNETLEEPAQELPDNYTIGEKDPLEHIGEIISVVEKSIVIKGNLSGEFRILKEGSVFCLEDRTPIGYLLEVFGPVAHPLYRVQFNSAEKLEKFKDKKGSKVFYVVPKSTFIYTDTIKSIKGSDASNWHDEEVPEEEQEFSDDEKEMESKKAKKKKRTKRDYEEEKTSVNETKKQKNSQKNNSNINKKPWRPIPQYQPQQFSAPASMAYQSRSQRENPLSPQPYQNPPPPQFYPPPPPPTQMAPNIPRQQFPQYPPFAPFPLPPMIPGQQSPFIPQPMMPPMPPIPQGIPPNQAQMQQMQQFFHMQNMMMQQFYHQQQNGQFPPGPPLPGPAPVQGPGQTAAPVHVSLQSPDPAPGPTSNQGAAENPSSDK